MKVGVLALLVFSPLLLQLLIAPLVVLPPPGAPLLVLCCCQGSSKSTPTPNLSERGKTLTPLCLLGLGIEGSLQLPNCMRCVRSHRAITTSSAALNSVTEAGSLPSGWVVLSQTLERYYAPRGLLPPTAVDFGCPYTASLPAATGIGGDLPAWGHKTVTACHRQHPGARRRFFGPLTPPAFFQPSRADETVGSHRSV